MSPRRNRLVAGCRRCRVRHLKCDINDLGCEHCQQAGVDCDRANVRFRNGLSLPKEAELAFSESCWPQVKGKVRFHDETPEIASLYSTIQDGQPAFTNGSSCLLQVGLREELDSPSGLLAEQRYAANGADEGNALAQFPAFTAENVSPSILSLSSPRSIQSRTSSSPLQPLSEREAILLRNFVENMALWADITDPQRHFETEVSARTLKEPVLRYAIFAFSSRHLDRQDNTDVTEALQYHNCCVQLLIPALSGPREHITEDILAAVAILRQHEEMDGEDNQFHLTGTTHILNTVSTFGSSGGLGEAAAWLCLRQDIYVSLTSQRPLRTNLQSFYHSDVFQRNDDFAWSSRMVFLLANVLQGAFTDSTIARDTDQIEEWYSTKPHTFDPVRSVPRGPEPDQRLPTIWMLLPVHVIGIQYYHIAKIVLALSESPRASSTYESLRHSRAVEKNIRHHLLMVLGLAQSNAKAENTLFTARHSLVAWGWVLRHPLDQRAAESLLQAMHARTGWNMDSLIQTLRAQWQEVDENME
ncbi:hypothetical protein PENNAL_c0074G03396 [Penicillium nalgiovense]|uniref:Zn(2)-C6 fungal-type domain-containing protein n=1 Tax=Penicillium nalgiovense TaxID=60175 RepID=A0A1V6XIR6_PENNA|nr:hypothetical protein PENNAL_c0074G03396 [Penicillium nalgiovense]